MNKYEIVIRAGESYLKPWVDESIMRVVTKFLAVKSNYNVGPIIPCRYQTDFMYSQARKACLIWGEYLIWKKALFRSVLFNLFCYGAPLKMF